MNTKDWILLLTPIVFDGIVFVVLQKIVIDKYIKHRMLKDEIVKTFLDKLKHLISHMIQSNFDSMTDGDSVNDNVLTMQKEIVDIVKYYHTNIYDLKKFQEEFDRFNECWMCFQTTLNNYARKPVLTEEMKKDLGEKMQNVFDSLNGLIEKVRKKY